jgi:hypothetical protein
MAAIVQKGTTVAVGFGSQTYSGFVMQVVSGPNPDADVSTVVAEDGSTATVLIANKKKTLELEAVVTAAGLAAAAALKQSNFITVNSINYRVLSVSINRGPKETTVRVSCVKETSMTYA